VTSAGLNIPANSAVAKDDAFVVKCLRDAGCIVLGKLNMHEAALGASNDNPHHGKCFNPHQLSHTPGGSSGGSGSAVAAGLCAYALGTDTMGSVRIPASYCGVSGLKPSFGAVSIGGTVLVSRRLDNVGPLARSARDLNLIFPIMAHYDPACAQSKSYEFEGFSSGESATNFFGSRFAVVEDLETVGVEPDVIKAFHSAIKHIAVLGLECIPRSLGDFDYGASRRSGLLVAEVDMALQHESLLLEHPEYFSDDLIRMIEWGKNKSSIDLARADWRLDAASVKMAALLTGVDFLMLPTAPQAAFNFSQSVPAGQADLTNLANMSGYPAASVPMGVNSQGLPLGLQIIGRPGSDLKVLALAEWFSQIMTKSEKPYRPSPIALLKILRSRP